MPKVKFKNVRFKGIKAVVPEKFIDIEDELQYFENNPKKVARAKKILGFGKRHFVDNNVTAVDLCYEAARQLFDELKYDKNEIDASVFLSQGRDYSSPTSANVLHGMLELSENCAAMDISQGCSGYIYALWNVCALISSGAAKKVLLLSGDTPSKGSFQSNRLVNPIFGDSGSATIIEYDENAPDTYFSLGSKGKDWELIIAPAGGSRIPIDKEILESVYKDENNNEWKLNHMIMEGIKVFDFTMTYVPQSINEIIEFSKTNKEDINLFILHQANKQIVETIAIKTELPFEKTPTNTFSEYGNNACNSVAVNLSNNLTKENSSKVLLCGYGIGMSWGSAVLNLSDMYNGGVSIYKTQKNQPTIEELKRYWINKFINKGENNE